jgi:hypothetical protein
MALLGSASCNNEEDPLRISKLRRLTAGTVVSCICALAAAEAASAVPALWNSAPTSAQVQVVGSVKIKVGTSPTPQTTFTCYPSTWWFGDQVFHSGSPLTGYANGIGHSNFCYDGATTPIMVEIYQGASNEKVLQAERNGTTYSLRGSTSRRMKITSVLGFLNSASGEPASYSGVWVNGMPSTLTFNNAVWGKVSSGPLVGQPITVTGTFSYGNGLKLV